MKVVVIAGKRQTLGFLLGGVHEGFIADPPGKAAGILDRCLARDDIGVILVSEEVAKAVTGRIQEVRRSPRMVPIITIIPETGQESSSCIFPGEDQ